MYFDNISILEYFEIKSSFGAFKPNYLNIQEPRNVISPYRIEQKLLRNYFFIKWNKLGGCREKKVSSRVSIRAGTINKQSKNIKEKCVEIFQCFITVS